MADPGIYDAVVAWEKAKKGLYSAILGGLGTWLTGRGAPGIAFTPTRPLAGPGASYGPENYQGIGKMGQRLRLAEDESSAPMTAIRTAVEKNPLLKGVKVLPGHFAQAPTAKGGIAWRVGKPPVIALAPDVSPENDPTLVLTHEAVGHGSHGHVAGKTRAAQEQVVTPRLEGVATGATKRIYGDLDIPSVYESRYGNDPAYREAQQVGAELGRLAAKEEVPPQRAVLGAVFGKGGRVLGYEAKPKPVLAGGS